MTESVGQKILIEYSSKNTGKHPVRGLATKTYYGYRRRGDIFEVYESDARVRPDLFRPANVQPQTPFRPTHRGRPQEAANVLGATAISQAVQKPPAPPEPVTVEEVQERDPYELPSPLEMPDDPLAQTLDSFDWERSINKRHLKILADNNIIMLRDLVPLTEDNLLSIKGIGANVTRALFSKLEEEQH